MSEWVAITVLGKDRPGIVAGVTQVLFEHGCNLEDSSAMRLRDSFAMILIAKLPADPSLEALDLALAKAAGDLEVVIDLRPLGAEPSAPPPAGRPYTIHVYGADRPGIVYHVTEELARLDCNVTEVTTHSQGDVYVMLISLTVPERIDEAQIERRLDGLRECLRVDISLAPDDGEIL